MARFGWYIALGGGGDSHEPGHEQIFSIKMRGPSPSPGGFFQYREDLCQKGPLFAAAACRASIAQFGHTHKRQRFQFGSSHIRAPS